MQEFVHLHVHTQYSLLDGQTNIKKLVDKAIADGMKGVAVTDHGNMMGIKVQASVGFSPLSMSFITCSIASSIVSSEPLFS